MPAPHAANQERVEPRGKWVVRNIDAFYAGQHRTGGTNYTEQDLKDMEENARLNAGTYDPPIVIGHSEDQKALLEDTGVPKWGEAKNIRFQDGLLKLDADELAEPLAKWIADGNYDRVSIEVWPSPPKGMKGKGKMVRRVAALGGYPAELKQLAKLPRPQWESHGELFARARTLISTAWRLPSGHYEFFSEVVMNPEPNPTPTVATQPDHAQTRESLIKDHGWDQDIVHAMPDEHVAHAHKKMCEARGEAPHGMGDDDALAHMGKHMDGYAEKCLQRFGEKCKGMKGKRWSFTEDQPMEQFSEEKIGGIIEARLAKLLGERLGAIETTAKSAVKSLQDQRDESDRLATEKFCERLVQEGRLLRRHLDKTSGRPSIADLINKIDGTTVEKFSENNKEVAETPREQLKRFLADLPKINRGELLKSGNGPDADLEVAKVERFAEQPQIAHALAANNQTPAQWVANFKALREKNPAMTAAQYGVQE